MAALPGLQLPNGPRVTAALRTVRLLSAEPGQPKETRTVKGVVIEKGVPLPVPNHCIGEIIAALEVGESFTHPFKLRPTAYKRQLAGKEFTQRRIGPKLFRIWRVR